MNHIRSLPQCPLDMLDTTRGYRCLCGYILRSPREQKEGCCIECRFNSMSSNEQSSKNIQATNERAGAPERCKRILNGRNEHEGKDQKYIIRMYSMYHAASEANKQYIRILYFLSLLSFMLLTHLVQ
jgi:hypothetical protein